MFKKISMYLSTKRKLYDKAVNSSRCTWTDPKRIEVLHSTFNFTRTCWPKCSFCGLMKCRHMKNMTDECYNILPHQCWQFVRINYYFLLTHNRWRFLLIIITGCGIKSNYPWWFISSKKHALASWDLCHCSPIPRLTVYIYNNNNNFKLFSSTV